MKRSLSIIFSMVGATILLCIVCIVIGLYSQNSLSSFNKTHFIVGYPELPPSETTHSISGEDDHLELDQKLVCSTEDIIGLIQCHDGTFKQAFFSPDDNLQKILISLIEHEQEAIKIAIYSFTNGAIAQALAQTIDRNVKVELIVDASCLKDRFNKIEILKAKGVTPLIYHASNTTLLSDIMHNKFVIFKRNIQNKAILWTGSFNFTKSAQIKNQENVIVLEEKHIIDRYEKQYEVIKHRIAHPSSPTVKMAHRRVKKRKAAEFVVA